MDKEAIGSIDFDDATTSVRWIYLRNVNHIITNKFNFEQVVLQARSLPPIYPTQ